MRKKIQSLSAEAGALAVAAAYYDYETHTAWSYHGDRWFHAASTIKVAVLLALFDAVAEGRFQLRDWLHVRNRFSSAVQGEPFRVSAGRDADAGVYERRGKTMRLQDLAYHMITTSSNLATNLLLDLVGVDAAQQSLARRGLARGLDIRRGVEDERAFESSINNQVTANGLVQFYRMLQEESDLSAKSASGMREILLEQQFRSGIPAGLPDEVREDTRFAHKTGEISTVAHDAGLVFLPSREPYAIAILTEWSYDSGASPSDRRTTVASISRALYDHLTERTDG